MSISKVEIFDIEPLRYRRIFDIEASKIDIDAPRYRRNIDIEVQNFDIVISRYRTKRRYRVSELRYRYIPISKISRYRKMLLRYLYTMSRLLIRYRISCSSISVFLCLVCCSSCSFRDTHCRVHYLLRIIRLACGLLQARRITQRRQRQGWR